MKESLKVVSSRFKVLPLSPREALLTVALAAFSVCLRLLVFPLVSSPSSLACLSGALSLLYVTAARILRATRERLSEDAAARRRLEEALAAAEAERLSAETCAARAEDKRAVDAEKLAALVMQLEAFGDASARAARLRASDRAGTRAAELRFYEGQAAAAEAALAGHRERAEALRDAELPGLRAQVQGLGAALAEAKSKEAQAETDRQSVDITAEKLAKEGEDLWALHREQKEELQRIDAEMEVLQTSAEEAKERLREETQEQLKKMSLSAEQDGRQTRLVQGAKRSTEQSNEVLRAALQEQDDERERLEAELANVGGALAEREQSLETLRSELGELEETARQRCLAEKDAARRRERAERAQSGLEGLRGELLEAREALKRAERVAEEAEAPAAARTKEADELQEVADARLAEQLAAIQDAVQRRNAAAVDLQREHTKFVEAARRIHELRHKLEASGAEKCRLIAELQRVYADAEA